MALSFSTLLFVPGSRPERIAKALGSAADMVCVDLEDAVPADGKAAARAAALAALGDARLAIRINALTTIEGIRDLAALIGADCQPAALLLPMVDEPGEVRVARAALPQVPLIPLIESAAGLAMAARIAAEPGVAAMMFGGGDLANQLGVALAWEPLLVARSQLLLACAGAGVGSIDVPFIHLDDQDGLARESRAARALGFTAKAAIHPAQIDAIARAFAPSDADRADAHAAIAAWEQGDGGPIQFRGRMLEAPLIARYRAMLDEGNTSNA